MEYLVTDLIIMTHSQDGKKISHKLFPTSEVFREVYEVS